MQPRKTALPLLMCSLAIATSACEPKRIVTNLPPPAERLQCVGVTGRPTIPGEYKIDWSRVTTVAQARSEHEKFVAAIRTREGVIAGYVLEVEGKLFTCSNNAQWLREYYKATS